MSDQNHCDICGTELDQDSDPLTRNCGGTCLCCMAESGDPDCIEAVHEITAARREALRKAG